MARRFNRSILLVGAVIALATRCPASAKANPQPVTLTRVPDGGIQPQSAVDSKGVLHLIYLKGDPGSADIYYVLKPPGETKFSEPIRVNSKPGSAMAIGSVRGPQLAIGRNGRVHVAWMGAHPEGPEKIIPMLYARLNDAKTAFEPERNVMQFAAGLDGGSSVAADRLGNVYVVWHANPQNNGEAHRRVWVARSSDDGKTFAREISADPPLEGKPSGACGCCGMRALTGNDGTLYILYRAATDDIHRDMILLASQDHGRHFAADRVAAWQLNACPMSTDFIARAGSGILIAWETAGQVFYARVAPGSDAVSPIVSPPGAAIDRKHPVVISNSRGLTLLAWTDGTAWQRGGSVVWQIFDRAGRPLDEATSLPGLPVWDLVAASVDRNGKFSVLY
jgi:hypothetical protein